MDSTQPTSVSDLVIAEWYLRPAHRVLWALPLFAALTIVIVAAMLRSDAGDPAANLQSSTSALVALKPAHPADSENAAILLRRAFSAQIKFTIAPGASQDIEPVFNMSAPSAYYENPSVIAYFQANAPAIQQLHAAVSLPHCDWDVDYRLAYGMLLPHLAPLRQSAKLLAGSARLKAHNGDHAGAAKDIQAMYRLADMAESDAPLICCLVGIAIHSTADGAIESILAYDPPRTLEDLAHYQHALRADRKIVARLKRAMQCERDSTLATYDRLAMNPSRIQTAVGQMFPEVGFALLYGSERNVANDLFNAYLKELDTNGMPPSGTFGKLLDAQDRPAVLTRMIVGIMENVELSYLRSQEQAYLLQCALAVQAFKIAKKRDPKSLDELVLEFLPEIPTSVFKNAAFSIMRGTGELRGGNTVSAWFSGKPVLKVYSFGKDAFDNQRLEPDAYLGDRVIKLNPEPGDVPQPLQEDGK